MKRKKRARKSRHSVRRRRGAKSRLSFICKLGLAFLIALTIVLFVRSCTDGSSQYKEYTGEELDASKPEIDVQLLEVNAYSRPGIESGEITGIVIHYTANPGATAQNNRDYFEGLKTSHKTKASSHFIVGLDGEIIQCVPTWEIAYASNDRNTDTVSIECCDPDESGRFNEKTYRSMVQLTAWLCKKFGLNETDVIRHYDVTGKDCPKYFVEHEDAWSDFRTDVKKALEKE